MSRQLSVPRTVAAVEVDVFDIEGVYMAGKIAEESEADVDKQVCAAPGYYCDSHGWHCASLAWLIQVRGSIQRGAWLAGHLRRRVIRMMRMAGAASDMLTRIPTSVKLVASRGLGLSDRVI